MSTGVRQAPPWRRPCLEPHPAGKMLRASKRRHHACAINCVIKFLSLQAPKKRSYSDTLIIFLSNASLLSDVKEITIKLICCQKRVIGFLLIDEVTEISSKTVKKVMAILRTVHF